MHMHQNMHRKRGYISELKQREQSVLLQQQKLANYYHDSDDLAIVNG